MSSLRVRVLAVSALLLIPTACSGDDTSSGSGNPSTPTALADASPSPTPSEASEPALPDEVEVVATGGETIPAMPFADFMVAAGDDVWVSGVEPGVVAYDASTGEITHRVPFEGEVVQAMEASDGVVYAVAWSPSALLRIDARSGRALPTTRLPGEVMPESSPAVDGSTAWVLVDAGTTFQVVEDGHVGRSMPAPEGALAARFGFGSLWVTQGGGRLARVDPDSGDVRATYDVGLGARFLTIGEDAVWTLDAADGTVTRVDPRTGDVDSVLVSELPIQGGDIAADLGSVWARTSTGVTRVDPSTLVASARVAISPGSGSVAAAADWLWLSDHDHNAVHRVPLSGLTGG